MGGLTSWEVECGLSSLCLTKNKVDSFAYMYPVHLFHSKLSDEAVGLDYRRLGRDVSFTRSCMMRH